jgi:hypothetical protein
MRGALNEALREPGKAVKFLRDMADAIEAHQRMKEVFRGKKRSEKEGTGHA